MWRKRATMSRYSVPVRKLSRIVSWAVNPIIRRTRRRVADDVSAGDARRARVRAGQGREDAHRGRLARAVRAQQRQYLTGLGHERHAVEGGGPRHRTCAADRIQSPAWGSALFVAEALLLAEAGGGVGGVCSSQPPSAQVRWRRPAETSRSARRASTSGSRPARPRRGARAGARPGRRLEPARSPSRSGRSRSRHARGGGEGTCRRARHGRGRGRGGALRSGAGILGTSVARAVSGVARRARSVSRPRCRRDFMADG